MAYTNDESTAIRVLTNAAPHVFNRIMRDVFDARGGKKEWYQNASEQHRTGDTLYIIVPLGEMARHF